MTEPKAPEGATNALKIIAVEEHILTPGIGERLTALPYEEKGVTYNDHFSHKMSAGRDERLADMDTMGVDVQVLSVTSPATQVLEPRDAVKLAREANDAAAEMVARDPDRFACFATLPTPDPAAAVDELERAVVELGHCGVMLHGRTQDKFIDHKDFAPIFDKAAELKVPVHLHPQRPPKAIADQYYMDGLPEMVGRFFSSMAWGWHMETAVNAIRLILSGTFERTPDLQIILGHWGEMVPFFLSRTDGMLNLLPSDAPRTYAETFVDHFYLAPSGVCDLPMLQHAIAVVGVDRILYSTDYPFHGIDGSARKFLEDAPISPMDKQKIGHLNATRLLKLDESS